MEVFEYFLLKPIKKITPAPQVAFTVSANRSFQVLFAYQFVEVFKYFLLLVRENCANKLAEFLMRISQWKFSSTFCTCSDDSNGKVSKSC